MIFKRADILLPSPEVDPEKWSVIACDQHSAEPEYWDELDRFVGSAPSSLRMILPEAYLSRDNDRRAEHVHDVMRDYLAGGVFQEIPESYVYVENALFRCLPSRAGRHGGS